MLRHELMTSYLCKSYNVLLFMGKQRKELRDSFPCQELRDSFPCQESKLSDYSSFISTSRNQMMHYVVTPVPILNGGIHTSSMFFLIYIDISPNIRKCL